MFEVTQKIQDMIESSKVHHTQSQHELLLMMFGLFQAQSLSIRACKLEHLESLQSVLQDSWGRTLYHATALCGMTNDEFEQVSWHLSSMIDAFNSHLAKVD